MEGCPRSWVANIKFVRRVGSGKCGGSLKLTAQGTAGMEGSVRIRLKFEDLHMLSSQQKAEGLEQSWMTVNPHLKTVAELINEIKSAFHLHETCPYGVLLSMEGFVLPPSQPIWIIKDKDIVSVNRKRGVSGKDIFSKEGANNSCFTLDGLMLPAGVVKLQAMDEFEEETGGYQSEYEDDGTDIKEDSGIQLEKPSNVKDSSRKKRKRLYQDQSLKLNKTMVDNHAKTSDGVVDVWDDGHIHKKKKSGMHVKDVECSAKVQSNGVNKIKEFDMQNLSKLQSKDQELLSHEKHEKIKDKEAQGLKATKKNVKIQHDDQRADRSSKRMKNIVVDIGDNSLHCGAMVRDNEHIHKKNGKHMREMKCRGRARGKDDVAKMKDLDIENEINEMEEHDLENHYSLQSQQQEPELVLHKKMKDKKAKRLKETKEPKRIKQDDQLTHRCFKRDEENGQFQGKMNSSTNASTPVQEKKFPSRSARRKKAKRHWLREQAKAKDKELIQNRGTLDRKIWSEGLKIQKANQEDDAEAEEESLPIVVRPGHIRFEPLEDPENENYGADNSMPLLQWNGITNKRQGQNWGKEKNNVNRLNDAVCSTEAENPPYKGAEGSLNERLVDFEKFPCISGLPQEGDTIAYRLVELSSSWCPELSCFRVGKVASYDHASGKVLLESVLEHPVVIKDTKQDDEDYVDLTNISLYNEDGSLEIDFASLVDVRVMSHNVSTVKENHNEGEKPNWSPSMNAGNLVVEEPETGEAHANEGGTSKSSPKRLTEHIEGGDGESTGVWQEIDQMFSAKKAELSIKNVEFKIQNSNEKTRSLQKSKSIQSKESDKISEQKNGSNGPWPFKALKGSALGPTISLLREQHIL